MKNRDPDLLLFHAPLLRQGMTTPNAMRDVLYALAPATAASLWFFGISAALILTTCIAGAVLAEWLFANKEARGESLRDASGILTGLLLGLTLPPGLPLWMAFLGGFVGIALGKVIWGGLGHNLFNPALLGRAFLLATFPIAMTTWVPATGDGGFFDIYSGNLALPFMQVQIDGISAATPLGMLKFEQEVTPLANLACLAMSAVHLEKPAVSCCCSAEFILWLRRDLDWRIPVSILLTVVIFSACLGLFDAARFPTPHVLGVFGWPVTRRNLHGDRSGDIASHTTRCLDFRHRCRCPRDADSRIRRPAGRRDVRDTAHERGNATD